MRSPRLSFSLCPINTVENLLAIPAMPVKANLRFLKRLELYESEKPFQIFCNIPIDAEDQRQSNLEFEEFTVALHDIRQQRPAPSLDNNGFTTRKHSTAMKSEDFLNRELVESIYLPEIEALLREAEDNIDRIFIFDWRVC